MLIFFFSFFFHNNFNLAKHEIETLWRMPVMYTVHSSRGCPGRDHMVVGFTSTYAISDLRQVDGFLRVLWIRFPPPIKLTATILLIVVLNTLKQTTKTFFFPLYLQILLDEDVHCFRAFFVILFIKILVYINVNKH